MEVLDVAATLGEKLLEFRFWWHAVFLKKEASNTIHEVLLGLRPIYRRHINVEFLSFLVTHNVPNAI